MIHKKKKRVLIIVHGATPFHFKNKFLEHARRIIFKILTAEKGILMKDYKKLGHDLGKHYDSVEFLKWDGRAVPRAKTIPEAKTFERLIKKHSDELIDVVAVSLGGFVVEKGLANFPKKIQNLLYIGAVHNGKLVSNKIKKVINVYSKKDKMFKVANEIYEGLGNLALKGENVVNVALNNLNHDELCQNKSLNEPSIKNKNLYDLYSSLLKP